MAQQRQYEAFQLFNVRIVDMRHLWVPSDMYKGKKQEKPNYFAGFIVQKTQSHWMNEPGLASMVQAMGRIHANNPQVLDWRIEDGDTPNAEGKSSEFAKGHWLFNGSSSNPINVELVQAGGTLAKLQNKVGVKSGDYCAIGGTVAVSGQDQRRAKIYLNAVVFTAPGEEIVFSNSVSGAELMAQAQRQGLQVAGFSASPMGFGAQPQSFGAQQFGAPPQPFGGAAPGFSPPGGAHQPPAFAPPTGPAGFAPTPGSPAMAYPSNPGAPQFGAPPAMAYPGAPQPQQFGAPPAFGPGVPQQFGAPPAMAHPGQPQFGAPPAFNPGTPR